MNNILQISVTFPTMNQVTEINLNTLNSSNEHPTKEI